MPSPAFQYIEELLSKGESLEFFIEAGRSRTGKSLMPKAGLFSIVVESFLQGDTNLTVDWNQITLFYCKGVIPDAHIIPVAMSYEKILDGNFVCELTVSQNILALVELPVDGTIVRFLVE